MNDLLTRACLCLLFIAGPVFAQEDEGQGEDEQLMIDPAFSDDPAAVVPAEPSAAERQRAADQARGPETAAGTGALLRGLDKITGRTEDFDLSVGQVAEFGRLEVRLSECRYPAADPTSDAYAVLTVTGKRATAQVFAGWMVASSPALSALDDSRYDVWVISCNRS